MSLAVVVLVAGCNLLDPNPGPDPLDPPAPMPDPLSVAFGEEVFAQRCQRCHGFNGGGGSVYELPIIGCENVDEVTREGKGAMPAFPDLSDNARASIQLYLDSLSVALNIFCP